jgi:hypothetical protein
MTSNVQRASLGIVARSNLDRRPYKTTNRIPWRAGVLAVAMFFAMNSVVQAHGVAGQRFFPATILTDDPFVADEGSLPTVTLNPTGPDGSQETDIGTDLSKRITRNLDFTLHTQWAQLHPVGAPATTSWGGLNSGLQYQLFVNDDRESMGLVGLNVSWAGGLRNVTTLTPTFDFGKGLGELPESLKFLRPLAVTGNLSFDFPTQTESAGAPNPNNFNYGFAFEYSLPYLQCCVKDVGLRHPFSQMIPLVEVAFSTPVNRNAGLKTTGTIQPGVIWSGKYYQIGAEAIIPANGATGHGLGAIVQLHWYLDDLFPHSIGQPILRGKS